MLRIPHYSYSSLKNHPQEQRDKIETHSGISYTIILNISGHDEPAIDPSQSGHDDRIDQLTQTVNTLHAQLTTVLSITQNNHFLVSPPPETPQVREISLPAIAQRPSSVEASPPHFQTTIQPLRMNVGKGQNGLHLLTLVAQQTAVASGEQKHETAREGHVEVQEEPRVIQYPIVPGVSTEKVKQLIDAFLKGGKWRDMPGNYSQTIKPVREAWERLHTP